MANLHEIVQWCNQTLKTNEFKDYAPNGLQIEGELKLIKFFALSQHLKMQLMQQLSKMLMFCSYIMVTFGKANRIQSQECVEIELKN